MKRTAVLALLFAGLSLPHGFHASLTSMDFYTATKALEVTVVVNADDLENALRRQTGRAIEIDRTPDAEALTSAYLARSLELQSADGTPALWKWVGMEVKANFVHLYVETKVSNTVEGMKIRDRLLFDLLPDQVNLLTVKRDRQGRSSDHVFPQGGGFQTITLAAR